MTIDRVLFGASVLLLNLGRVRLGSIRNKNNWNNASRRLFGSYSHSGIPGFHSGYSAPGSRIAGIYSGIHSYSGIFPNERALKDEEAEIKLTGSRLEEEANMAEIEEDN